MTRSYKMVVLDAMLEPEGFRRSISLDELAGHFRRHFSKARYSRDFVGADIEDVMQVAPTVLDAHIRANPINAWIGGNTGAASPWFEYDGTRTFSYIGSTTGDDAAFAEAIKERVDRRLESNKDQWRVQIRQVRAHCDQLDCHGTRWEQRHFAGTSKTTGIRSPGIRSAASSNNRRRE